MMLCFKIPKDGTTKNDTTLICLDIPLLINPWWKKFRNPGGPIEIFTDGWIRGEQIGAKQARDLSILASIHELTSQLSPQLKRSLEEPVSQAFKAIELPKFATLSFDEQQQKEYHQ